MGEIFNDMVSSFFGKRWLVFFLVALFLSAIFGVRLFSTPKYEVMYNHAAFPSIQTEKITAHCHLINIGNTGRKRQDSVAVILSTEAYKAVAMKPTVRDFGKVDRQTVLRQNDETTSICLGPVESGKRIEIRLLYLYRQDETPFEWDEIFKGVESARGKTLVGDPGWTTVGRMLYAVFG